MCIQKATGALGADNSASQQGSVIGKRRALADPYFFGPHFYMEDASLPRLPCASIGWVKMFAGFFCKMLQKTWLTFVAKLSIVVQLLSHIHLWDPMDRSTPSFPVLRYLPEFASTQVHWVSDHLTISSSLATFSSWPQYFPASGSFSMSRLFAPGGQSTEFQLQRQSFQWIFTVDFL